MTSKKSRLRRHEDATLTSVANLGRRFPINPKGLLSTVHPVIPS
ncbi:hypothetical protein [Alicyclobacillus mengziensis]|nr:hypothetical protein [Alicyclobacillus mengziensis]